jgi:hypothetical protein
MCNFLSWKLVLPGATRCYQVLPGATRCYFGATDSYPLRIWFKPESTVYTGKYIEGNPNVIVVGAWVSFKIWIGNGRVPCSSHGCRIYYRSVRVYITTCQAMVIFSNFSATRRLYYLESIDLSVVSIHATYNQLAAAPWVKMARKVSVHIIRHLLS